MAVARRRLQKIGNSTGVVVPAEMLREMGLAAGDEVVVRSEQGKLTVVPFDVEFDEQMAAAERFITDRANAMRKLAE